MLVDRYETRCLAESSHYEQGKLWTYNVQERREEWLQFSTADYVTLRAGEDDLFVALHHLHTDHLEITAHHMLRPTEVLSRITVVGGHPRAEGDAEVWNKLPRAHIAHHQAPDMWVGPCMVYIHPDELEMVPLKWHSERYNSLAQPVIDAVSLPGGDLIILVIQGDSRPPIYSISQHRIEGYLELPGRQGCRRVRIRPQDDTIWVLDGDTICRLHLRTLERLDDARIDMEGMAADFCFHPIEEICAISRPMQEDVVGIDFSGLSPIRQAYMGGGPHEFCLLGNWQVVARDNRGQGLTGRLDAAWQAHTRY